MGNQSNNFINCGINQKQSKQQIISTREQAIKTRKGDINYRNDQDQKKYQNKLGTANTNINNINQNKTNYGKNNSNYTMDKLINNNKYQLPFFPEHENLSMVSKTPKTGYIKSSTTEYYEEEKGKCLDQIIQSRYNTAMHFPEHQIRGLLESLIYGLAYMAKKDINHHDFYPTNIYYNNGCFKILNPLMVKYSGYSITQQRKRFSFLSPQLILEILNDTSELDIGKDVMDRSDVFAIGMILLQFCTLQPSSQCYDSETYNIIDLEIQKRLDKTTQLYNPLIADCIDLMLQYEVNKRISPIELALAVHSKTRQLKIEEISQKSRINYQQINDARVSMSKLIPQPPPNQQFGPMVNRPPAFIGNPTYIYNLPPGMIPPQTTFGVPPQTTSNFLQQQIRGGVLIPPQVKISDSSPPYEIASFSKPNISSLQTTTISTPSSSQVNLIQGPSTLSSDSFQFKKPTYINTELKSSQINKNPYLSPTPTSIVKPQIDLPTLGYNHPVGSSQRGVSPGSKKKLNPFEEIEEAIKEDEDEQKIQNPVQPTKQLTKTIKKEESERYDNTYSTNYSSKLGNYAFKTVSKPSNEYLNNDYSKYSSKYSSTNNYTNSSYTNSYTNSYTSSNNYLFGEKKEQSLDQRVKRLLENTKNIK